MIEFPNAKINLGLNIVGKRKNGYHNIESVFYPVSLCDGLEIVKGGSTRLFVSGNIVQGPSSSNLCMKAYELLKKDFKLSPIHIYLHKKIPMGAGLGGGSSDGAFMLKLLNIFFRLNLTTSILKKYAAQLGSDCTFFVGNTPSYVTGVGEKQESVSLNLTNYNIAIVHPGIHVNTAFAYSCIKPKAGNHNLNNLIHTPIAHWKRNIKNDFEEPIFQLHPEIAKIKSKLYKLGALYASMSGSGSAVYGIFKDSLTLEKHFPNYFTWQSVVNTEQVWNFK